MELRETHLREQKDFKNLSRSQIENHFKSTKAQTKAAIRSAVKPRHKIVLFVTNILWLWGVHYILNRFGPKHTYLEYRDGETGIYKLEKAGGEKEKDILIGLAADWATCTIESFKVAEQMKSHNPDYTIHLGDTYFVGSRYEMRINFLAEASPWVRGNKGSFALLGNHEMYARGMSYYKKLLPSLGIMKEDRRYDKQKASFFCLENEHWRILGLDTGYHSVGKPFTEILPFANQCRLDPKLIKWLTQQVRLGDPDDKRGLVILTHHQYVSAFGSEHEYTIVGEQLAALIGTERPVIWLCGHEHKLALYNKITVKDAVTAYVRCIGHGGMPIELDSGQFITGDTHIGSANLVCYDERARDISNPEYRLGYNGYAQICINNKDLSIEYYDTDKILLKEHWIADASGTLTGRIDFVAESDMTLVPGKTWDDITA